MHPGVLKALLAYLSFCLCDSLIKAIGPGTNVFQIGFFITLFSFIPVLAYTTRHDPVSAMFKMNQPWLVLGRAAEHRLPLAAPPHQGAHRVQLRIRKRAVEVQVELHARQLEEVREQQLGLQTRRFYVLPSQELRTFLDDLKHCHAHAM